MKASNDLVGGPIKRYGGKGAMADALIPHFATASQFIEPFFGGGGVFFQLPVGYWKSFVINDLDSDVANFFRCLRNNTEELIRVCEFTMYSREEYAAAFEPCDDPIERARRFWIRARQAFSGIDRKGVGWSRPTITSVSNIHGMNSKLESFRSFAAALRKCAAIENADAVDVIKNYAGPDTFIYCDPPYVLDVRKSAAYRHEMDNDHHKRFATACDVAVSAGAMVAVSGYDCELYQRLFKDWHRAQFDTRLLARHGDASSTRTEVLWMSYPPQKQIQSNRTVPRVVAGKTTLEKALAKQIRR